MHRDSIIVTPKFDGSYVLNEAGLTIKGADRVEFTILSPGGSVLSQVTVGVSFHTNKQNEESTIITYTFLFHLFI